MAPTHDAIYLQELVGDALSRGCAATVEAQPNDPVEFLGQWLIRYVKNAAIAGEFAEEQQALLAARKAKLAEAVTAANKAKSEQQTKRDTVVLLSRMVDEPRALMQRAVQLIKLHTAAGAAYVAAVADPEEPDWQPPEDPEDPAAAESDDEPDPAPPAQPTNQTDEADGSGAAASPDAAPEVVPPKAPSIVNYSKKYLSYLAASQGQDFMLTVELHRPQPPPEDDPEAKPILTPFTFRILDERRPMLYTGNSASEPSLRFFRDFPKIGAYQACGVQLPTTGEFRAVLAADTLFPEGSGQGLSQEDQDFIWHVSRALSQAFEAAEKRAAEALQGCSAQDLVDGVKESIIAIYHPRVIKDAAAGEAGAAPEEAEGQPAETEDAAAAPAGEGGDDPVATLKQELKSLEAQGTAAGKALDAASDAVLKAKGALDAIKNMIKASGGKCLPTLRNMWTVPQATFHVLKAVLHVLGKPTDTFSNWKRVFTYFTPALFDELYAYDASQERDLAAWKRARSCYKALGEDGPKKLAAELPDTHMGVLLLMWLKQVRKVARKAAAQRAAAAAVQALEDKQAATKVALAEAQRKAKEAEEARQAAEAAAAAEAEAAAAAEADAAEAPAEAE